MVSGDASREIRGGRTGSEAGFSASLLGFPLLITNPPLLRTHITPPPRCVISRTTQHIITSAVYKLRSSRLTRHLDGMDGACSTHGMNLKSLQDCDRKLKRKQYFEDVDVDYKIILIQISNGVSHNKETSREM